MNTFSKLIQEVVNDLISEKPKFNLGDDWEQEFCEIVILQLEKHTIPDEKDDLALLLKNICEDVLLHKLALAENYQLFIEQVNLTSKKASSLSYHLNKFSITHIEEQNSIRNCVEGKIWEKFSNKSIATNFDFNKTKQSGYLGYLNTIINNDIGACIAENQKGTNRDAKYVNIEQVNITESFTENGLAEALKNFKFVAKKRLIDQIELHKIEDRILLVFGVFICLGYSFEEVHQHIFGEEYNFNHTPEEPLKFTECAKLLIEILTPKFSKMKTQGSIRNFLKDNFENIIEMTLVDVFGQSSGKLLRQENITVASIFYDVFSAFSPKELYNILPLIMLKLNNNND